MVLSVVLSVCLSVHKCALMWPLSMTPFTSLGSFGTPPSLWPSSPAHMGTSPYRGPQDLSNLYTRTLPYSPPTRLAGERAVVIQLKCLPVNTTMSDSDCSRNRNKIIMTCRNCSCVSRNLYPKWDVQNYQ